MKKQNKTGKKRTTAWNPLRMRAAQHFSNNAVMKETCRTTKQMIEAKQKTEAASAAATALPIYYLNYSYSNAQFSNRNIAKRDDEKYGEFFSSSFIRNKIRHEWSASMQIAEAVYQMKCTH